MESPGYGNTGNSTGLSTNPDEGTLGKASSSAHAAVDSFANAADEATRKVKPKIDKVAGDGARGGRQGGRRCSRKPPTGSPNAAKALNAAQKKLVEDTCSYVSAHPLKSVGIAVLVGFLLNRIVF